MLGTRTNLAKAQAVGAARKAKGEQRFAENVAPVIQQIRASSITSLRGITATLNTCEVRTASGGRWAATQVSAVLACEPAPNLDPVCRAYKHLCSFGI